MKPVPASTALPDVPAELVQAAVTGHLVVLVGAGVSRGSKLPSWEELLEGLFARAKNEPLTPAQTAELADAETWPNLLERASWLRQTLGDSWLAGAIAAELRTSTAVPTLAHHALAALPGTAFVTTNYDRLLERAIADRGGRIPKTVLLSDIEGIRDFGNGQILKLHGDLDAPDTIVLSSEDYFRVTHSAAPAWKHRLQSLLQGPHRLLLVGYGYNDSDVQHAVDELRGIYAGKLPGPFWLTLESVRAKTKARALDLKPIWLSAYDDVIPWLEALARAVEAAKAQAPTVIKAVAYADALREHLKQEQRQAGNLFEQEEYEGAQSAYRRLLDKATALLVADPESDELKRLIASCRCNIAGCLVCLQRADDARALLITCFENDITYLSDAGRVLLAQGLAQVDERDKARAVLDVGPRSADVRAQFEEARLLIDVIDGRVPDGDHTTSPVLGLCIAVELLAQGRLDEAARAALSTIEKTSEHTLIRLHCTDVLHQALGRSAFEIEDAIAWIPISERGSVVSAIERGIRWLDGRIKVAHLQHVYFRLLLSFSELTDDEDGRRRAWQFYEDAGLDTASDVPAEMAPRDVQTLAQEGKLEEAFALLPSSAHPWLTSFHRASLYMLAHRFDEALSNALELARRFPGRAPVEHLTAVLLARAARPTEALEHARAAYAALPGRGYRLLLGQRLIDAGHFSEASEVLSPLAESTDPNVILARAQAAEEAHPRQAIDLWASYIDHAPDRPAARLRLAQLLFRAGRHDEAAETAWQVFDRAGDTADAKTLFFCAQFQRLHKSFDEEARERVRTVAKVLEQRFPGNPQAEHYRLLLRTALDFRDSGRPVDLDELTRAGFVRQASIDEVANTIQQQRDFLGVVLRTYRLGELPFEALCHLTHSAAATYLSGFAAVAEKRGDVLLCTPVAAGDPVPTAFTDSRILVGELELLLLQHLGVFGRVREALGKEGKLLIFRDVWERMVSAAEELEVRTQRTALVDLERLLEFLRSHHKVAFASSEHDSDVAWASAEGVALVDDENAEGMARLAPRGLVELLREAGHIDQEQASRVLRSLPSEAESGTALLTSLPARLAIGYAPLLCFWDAGALDGLLNSLTERLVVSPQASLMLEERRRSLNDAVAAANLAKATQRSVGAGITEGWIDARMSRPAIEGLPDVRVGEDREQARALYREPLANAFGFTQALIDDPQLWLLTADFFVSTTPGSHLHHIKQLSWADGDSYMLFASRMLDAKKRELHLPAFLQQFLAEPELSRCLGRLADLGFADALRPTDLIDLDKRYGGLNKAVPLRMLDRAEWMAADRRHVGADVASSRLAAVYSEAIWKAFLEHDWESRARGLADALLRRCEVMGPAVLERAILFVITNMISQPRYSFQEEIGGESDTLSLSEGSPSGLLWKYLYEFGRANSVRRGAFNRALRAAWLLLEHLSGPNGPTPAQFAALLLAVDVAPSNPKEPQIEAAAILSALWTNRPLQNLRRVRTSESEHAITIEETIGELADLAADPSRIVIDESVLHEAVTGSRVDFVVAPEAVLLRAVPDVAAALCVALAEAQGPHDGRAYELLTALAQNPDDPQARRNYAQMTVMAPWRVVREDPSVLKSWAALAHFGGSAFPTDIDDLRVMLSEPAGSMNTDQSLWDLLLERTSNGVWAKRRDVEELLEQAVAVPGFLPAALVRERLFSPADRFGFDVAKALYRVGHPAEYPCAVLAGDIYFLRAVSERRPQLRTADGDIDLRERLPDLFLHMLRAELRSPEDENMARAETEVLRLCGQVVRDLSRYRNVLFKDGLWLTYRLFQWLSAQLDAMPPSARTAALRELRELAPPVESLAPGTDDLLNPFAGRTEHRLATLLYALGTMDEVLAQAAPSALPATEPLRVITSTALEQELAEVAARPLSASDRVFRAKESRPSVLDWLGPGAVPDLALQALLAINQSAFFLMPNDVRLRWILDLPRSPDEKEHLCWSAARGMFLVLTMHADKLSAEEKVAFEERLRALEGGPDTKVPIWRWLGLTHLFAAGQRVLHAEVFQLLLDNIKSNAAPAAFGSYLRAISSFALDQMQFEVDRVLAHVEAAGIDPVSFAPGLASVVVGGNADAIPMLESILRQLSERPPFKDDERMERLLGTLGMK